MISVREKDLKQLNQIFEGVQIPIQVLANGSRVNGTSHVGNDLDLVYRKKDTNKADIDLLMKLKSKIENSNIPIIVEIRDWNMLPESFHEQIKQRNECLFKNY